MKLLNVVDLHAVSGGFDPSIVNKPMGEVTISEMLETFAFLFAEETSDQELQKIFPWIKKYTID